MTQRKPASSRRPSVTQHRDAMRTRRMEEIRAKISGTQLIQNIEKLCVDLISIYNQLKILKRGTDEPVAAKYRLMIAALTKAADIKLSLLKKVLPDLKQLEITDPDGKNPLTTLADAMKQAIAAARGDDEDEV